MRHSWEKVEEDLRRSVHEPRPVLHRCSRCQVYRASYLRPDGRWKSSYGQPYVRGWVRTAPDCIKKD